MTTKNTLEAIETALDFLKTNSERPFASYELQPTGPFGGQNGGISSAVRRLKKAGIIEVAFKNEGKTFYKMCEGVNIEAIEVSHFEG